MIAALRVRRAGLRGILADIAHEVDALPAPVLRELLPILRQAEQELARDLAQFLSRAGAEEKFTANQLRSALIQIRSAVDRVEELGPAMEGALRHGTSRAGKLATRHIERELHEFGIRFSHELRQVPFIPAVRIAASEKAFLKRHASTARRYATDVRNDIRRQLSLGLVRGENFEQLTKRLVRAGGPRGLVVLRGTFGEPDSYAEWIAEGLFRRYRYWAERIVRTEVLTVYNKEASATLSDLEKVDPALRQRWDATLDGRICSYCKDLDGEVRRIDQDFTGGISHPPAHPNCRCAVVAWREDWNEKQLVKRKDNEDG